MNKERRKKETRRPGVARIAELAGVSRTTVSNVIHGRNGKMTPQTREKILRIMEREGFVPNLNAINLAGSRSNIFGICVNECHGEEKRKYEFENILRTVVKAVNEIGCYVILSFTENIEEEMKYAIQWRMRGVFCIGFSEEQTRKLEEQTKIPARNIEIDSVRGDVFADGYREGTFYRSAGFQHIHYFASKSDGITDRWDGIEKVYSENLSFNPEKSFSFLPETVQERKEFYDRYLVKMGYENDLLIFEENDMALEAEAYLKSRGIKVPEEIAVAEGTNEQSVLSTIMELIEICK